MRTLLLSILCTGLSSAMAADPFADQPTSGMAYNTKELSALIYECGAVKDDRMSCKFNQIAVRRKMVAADQLKQRQALDKDLKTLTISAEMCKEGKEQLNAFTQTASIEELARFKDPRDRAWALKYLKALERACLTGDKAELRTVLIESIEREARTCRVSGNLFEQSFKRVSDPSAKTFTWVVDASPEGVCGIVQLSRFEPQKSSSFTTWNYVARKAITNPTAESFPGVKCSELDESTYVYSWMLGDGPTWADCDQVEFSMF